MQYICEKIIAPRILHSSEVCLTAMEERGAESNDGKGLSNVLYSLL